MGVMGCFRAGCDNVMCTRYSSKHGYICNECFEELIDMGVEANIKWFMSTPKKNHLHGMEEVARNRFEIEFPDTESYHD